MLCEYSRGFRSHQNLRLIDQFKNINIVDNRVLIILNTQSELQLQKIYV